MSAPALAQKDGNKQLLGEAHRARNRGRDRRAITLYRRVLLEDPGNAGVALRLAPMLARRGESFEAWQLYRHAARDLARQRLYNDCLGVYREACRFVPHEYEAWRLCAELQMKLGREQEAFQTLVDGRTQFRIPQTTAQAIALLCRARTIEPWDAEVVLDLAHLYAKTDQADVALELLSCIARREHGRTLRRTRALQWRITLSFRFAYLFLRSLLLQPEPEPSSTRSDERLRDPADALLR